jgi:hypothetical protein
VVSPPTSLSKKKESFLDKVAIITSEEPEQIGFVVRSMVAASMPHSRVKGLQFKRKNNNFVLTITGNEEAGGIPYGSYPRLILSWITSEAIRTASREIILGQSLSNFMRRLGLNVTGGRWGTLTRFKEQLKMLFSSSITMSYQENGQWLSSSMNIADKVQLFWDPEHPEQINLFGSKIMLGEIFFNEIISTPIPIDIRAVNALKDSSLALDIYFWLTYRMSYLSRPTEISYEKLHLQFGVGYEDTRHGRYEFKRKYLVQLQKVLALYPAAKIRILPNSLLLLPSKTHIEKNINNFYLPGFPEN